MNNKIKLIMLIASQLSDETCAKILKKIEKREIYLAANKEWNESDHPRDEEGRFKKVTERAKEIARKHKPLKEGAGATPHEYLEADIAELYDGKIAPKWKWRDRVRFEDTGEVVESERKEALIAVEKKLTALDELEKLELLMRPIKKARTVEENQKLVEKFSLLEDEIDRLEEKYGDRDKGFGMKWPKTEEADKDRKAYKKARRDVEKLKLVIDWTQVDA